MSLVTAQDNIRTAAEAARAAWAPYTLLVSYDGLEQIDKSTQVLPKMCVEVIFLDGGQLDLSNQPMGAQYGQIHLLAAAPIGSGSRRQLALLDHFMPYLELKNFSLVKTHMAYAYKEYEEKGWNVWPLLIPFWFHRLASAS
jgi:hypothetical protein